MGSDAESSGGTVRPTVVIAGATGFVGQALLLALRDDYRLVALTRSPSHPQGLVDGVEWRRCDLFSMGEVQAAMAGADYAVYLVHSMLPSARLTQASFADLDLLLADNFARAASKQGVRQILYLGGLLPDKPADALSPHLRSRLEVEQTLRGRGVPVTALRAGLVVGPGGSSMTMMVNLVRRLPVMALPRWTRSLMQPIALRDVIRAIRVTLGRPGAYAGPFDIGGPQVLSYAQLIQETAAVMDKRVRVVNVPVRSPELSKMWVRLFGGAPSDLVYPLVDSLTCDMVAQDNPLQAQLIDGATDYATALRASIDPTRHASPNPLTTLWQRDAAKIREARRVRSVQRFVLPPGWDARDVAEAYIPWLGRLTRPVVATAVCDEGRSVDIHLRFLRPPLLQLTLAPTRVDPDRINFYITGGLLTRPTTTSKGRFEFREVLGRRYVIAAIHDYAPRLSWWMYQWSQAWVHLVVMRLYGRRLAGAARRREGPPRPTDSGPTVAPGAPAPAASA